MAEKESEGKVTKLKRKFSRKSASKTTASAPVPETACPVSSKSATLPLSCDAKSLALHESHSEGLFSKLRRRFRLGSKGKYDLKSYTENSPSKHRWLRRKSEETHPQSDESSLSLASDPKISVGKSNSVRTQRKAKSDKEEVILVRKDKQVSVICKAENGESEVIFSNVNTPDEDLSETVSEVEEDPYATISSVKDEIARNKGQTVITNQTEAEIPCAVSNMNGVSDDSKPDEYTYAKIDPNRKNPTAVLQASLDTKNFIKYPNRVRSQIEPDYETLEEIEQKKREFRSQGNMRSSSFEAALISSFNAYFDPPGVTDPDYESLEEVKQRCARSILPSNVEKTPETTAVSVITTTRKSPLLDQGSAEANASSNLEFNEDINVIEASPIQSGSKDFIRNPRAHTASPQGSRPASMPSPRLVGRISSSSSPSSALAPLAPSIDSSLPNDSTLHQQVSPQEECIYDNPNIILRKQVTRSMTNTSSLTRRGQTTSEPPVIKTPAEEELVEKLSSLLAPPLPLRNYQKDEVNVRSGSGSARHSWASQTNRNTESGEFLQEKHTENSLLSSLSHSRENLLLKSAKDSLVNQVYERHDLFSRNNGIDSLRKKETSTLERYLKKSPHSATSNKLLLKDIKADYSVVNINKDKHEINVGNDDSVIEKISTDRCGKENKSVGVDSMVEEIKDLHDLGIVDFCYELTMNILKEVYAQCKTSEDASPQSKNTCFSTERDSEFEQNSIIKDTEQDIRITNIANGLACGESPAGQSLKATERYAKYVSTLVPDPSILSLTACPVAPLCSLDNSENNDLHITENDEESNLMSGNLKEKNSLKSYATEKSVEFGGVLYNQQGTRPKVKSLLLESAVKSSEPQCYSKNLKFTQKQNGNLGNDSNSEIEKTADEICPQISQTVNKLNSTGINLCTKNNSEIKIPRHKTKVKSEWIKKTGEEFDSRYFDNSDSSIQETVYVDSDTENDFELEMNKCVTVHVKRNQRILKVAKPVVYSNPRLLENLISGSFKRETSLNKAYLAHGIFRWGRYFPILIENRQIVDAKLKAFMNFVIEMLVSPARFRKYNARIRNLQEDVDRMQVKFEKRLKAVQGLPTFQDIRLYLLKTDILDDWEPEKPAVSYIDGSESHRDFEPILGEDVMGDAQLVTSSNPSHDECSGGKREFSEILANERTFSTPEYEAGDILHCEDSFSEVDEQFSVFNNRQTAVNLPTSSVEVLSEFMKLSKSRLSCQHCKTVEESDSEDEMVTLESYSRTVSTDSSLQLSNHISIGSASMCRAFHGELAYTSYVRKNRALRKKLNVPGPDYECEGSESHLSWNGWCCLDSLLKKLVPHISPRLDFQHLLRTYSEFKHFILIERQRNLDRKGCFMKNVTGHGLKCCRFEEFVFLKIIRDEIRYFSQVFLVSKASKDLFLEERDVGYSLLSLLRLVLHNIHKMSRFISKEEVKSAVLDNNSVDKKHVYFRNSSFQKWLPQDESLSNMIVHSKLQKFHMKNFVNFRINCLSSTLRNWKSPQAYVHDPNVLIACRTMFSHSDSKAFELAVKGVDEPRPLQEQQDFLESMEQLQLKDWYWGPISYEQATLILKDKEDGSFLVRDSSDQKYLLSLSFKSLGEVHHTRIEHAKGLFSFWSQPESHGKARICEFIEKSIQNSRDGRFLYFLRPSARGTPPLPIRLLTPVSRNFRVATLKHLSRFVVRQSVRKDHLDHLPVPEKVKRYLRDKQYYVEILDHDQWAFDVNCK